MKPFNLTFFLVFFSLGVTAQENHGISLQLNHLALSVSDVDRAATFYSDILGLEEITNKTKVDGIRWFSLGEGKELHLISTVKQQVTINKAVHMALTTPDFSQLVKKLDSMKIPYTDWAEEPGKISLRADGTRQIYIRDPDGYYIEINSVAED